MKRDLGNPGPYVEWQPELIFAGYLHVRPPTEPNFYAQFNPSMVADPEVGPPFDPAGRTVAQHERAHAQNFKDWYNKLVPDANSLEGWHCGKCKTLADQLAKKMIEVYYAQIAAGDAVVDGGGGLESGGGGGGSASPDWTGLNKLRTDYSAAGCHYK